MGTPESVTSAARVNLTIVGMRTTVIMKVLQWGSYPGQRAGSRIVLREVAMFPCFGC